MNRKYKFKHWLTNKVETVTPLSSYPNALENFIPQKLIEIGEDKYNNLFDCADINYLTTLKKRLLKGGDLHNFNVNTQSRLPSAAIDKYIKFLNTENLEFNEQKINTIKNIILYGAPGVGKTHNYQRIISMIENGDNEKEIFDTITDNKSPLHVELDKTTFKTIKYEKRVEFVTFHQSYSYEDFIEGFRPNDSGNIKLEDGLFKNISKKAMENTNKSFVTDKLVFSDALDILLKDKIEDEKTVKINLKRDNSFFEIYDYDNKSIYYARQGRDKDEKYHTLAVSTLNKMYDEEENNFLTGGLKTYYMPLLKAILRIGKESKVEKIEKKNFYIIIDEINRGNISKIFGELITLIEEDKRDKYEVKLPYSKETFKVPSNLYIIATMNSTDKSIATIDIALRRRFTFLKMKPNEELVTNIEAKELMEKLNKYIKDNLNEDYMLGHSYFMGEDIDLEFTKKYKLEPLLEEYFYAEEDKLKEVLVILNSLHVKETDDILE